MVLNSRGVSSIWVAQITESAALALTERIKPCSPLVLLETYLPGEFAVRYKIMQCWMGFQLGYSSTTALWAIGGEFRWLASCCWRSWSSFFSCSRTVSCSCLVYCIPGSSDKSCWARSNLSHKSDTARPMAVWSFPACINSTMLRKDGRKTKSFLLKEVVAGSSETDGISESAAGTGSVIRSSNILVELVECTCDCKLVRGQKIERGHVDYAHTQIWMSGLAGTQSRLARNRWQLRTKVNRLISASLSFHSSSRSKHSSRRWVTTIFVPYVLDWTCYGRASRP